MKIALCILLFAASLLSAFAQSDSEICSSVTCESLLKFASGPVDGKYMPYMWQCSAEAFTPAQISAYLSVSYGRSVTCNSSLTCNSCNNGACDENHQCLNRGCEIDNGGCSSVCQYNSTGSVSCSCFAGTALVNKYQCNCESFQEYPRVGWETSVYYRCQNSSQATTTGVIVVPGTTSTGSIPSGTTFSSTTGSSSPVLNSATRIIIRIEADIATFADALFINPLASFLGIAANRIRIYSKTAGSIVYDFGIQDGANGEKSSANALSQLLAADQSTLSSALGVTVLSMPAVSATTTTGADQPSNAVESGNDNGRSLSGGAIAGIVIGCVAFVVIVVAIIVFFVFRAPKRRDSRRQTELPVANNYQ